MQQWNDIGVPTSTMSAKCKPPAPMWDRTNRKEEFDFTYPDSTHIFADDLRLPPEELMAGAYLDIIIKTPPNTKPTPDMLISTGWGRKTVINRTD